MPRDPKNVVRNDVREQPNAQEGHHARPRTLPRRKLGNRRCPHRNLPPTRGVAAPYGGVYPLVHGVAAVKPGPEREANKRQEEAE